MQRRKFIQNIALTAGLLELVPASAQAYLKSKEKLDTVLSNSGEDSLWQEISEQFFLKSDFSYFNTGSLGPTPKSVVEAVNRMGKELEEDPVGNLWGGEMGKQMENVRQIAANFIGADTEEVMITANTTEGMNMIAMSLDLSPGDEILTTNHEHGGGMVCWQYLAKYRGIKMKYLELPTPFESKEQIVELVKENLGPKTRACSFMHIDTITGSVMPLVEISELLRSRDILLIADGAQAPGMLNVDVHALGVDAYCSSSHKWLLAPKGSGLLYIKKESQEKIKPLIGFSGYNVYSASVGTRNLPLIIGHGLAMDFHNQIGKSAVEKRCRELSGILAEKMKGIKNAKRITTMDEALQSGIVSYSLEGMKAADLYKKLLEKKIRIKVAQGTYAYVKDQPVNPGSYNAVRFSTHIFNTESQIEKLTQSISELLG